MNDTAPTADRSLHADTVVAWMAQQLHDGDVVATGVASPLAILAIALARATHAPDLMYISCVGSLDPALPELHRSSEDLAYLDGRRAEVSIPDLFDHARRGRVDVVFFGAGEIDGSGQTNMSAAGELGRPRVKFPGVAGASSLRRWVKRPVLLMPRQGKRSLVEKVQIASTTDPARRTPLITDLGIFEVGAPGPPSSGCTPGRARSRSRSARASPSRPPPRSPPPGRRTPPPARSSRASTVTTCASGWSVERLETERAEDLMKAMVLQALGGTDNFRFQDVDDPSPGPTEVLLGVRACGVCYHDLIARRGDLGPIPLPAILGHEVVGEVLEVGPGVTGWKVGDRAATLQRMSCGDCGHCARKRNSLCKNDRRFFGEDIRGGYATLMTAPVLGLGHIPATLSWPDAATVCCTTGTAVHVCRTRARIQAGETVLITGASGGVGLQAVQLCTQDGARVIAVTSSSRKVEALERAGAWRVVVARELDFAREVKKIMGGDGVDVALEIVGSSTFAQTLRCMAPGGRLVIVGNLDTANIEINPGMIIVKELEIIGAYATTVEELQTALDLTAAGTVKSCVSETMPLHEAVRAHARLENREVAGRLVLVPPN